MRTDQYTKVVLTIIAAALVLLVIKDYAPPLNAKTATVDVNIVAIDGQTFGVLQVRALKPALPVQIVER